MTITVTAVDADDDNILGIPPEAGEVTRDIVKVTLFDASSGFTYVYEQGAGGIFTLVTVAGRPASPYTVVSVGNEVTISGVNAGDVYEIDTLLKFDAVIVNSAATNTATFDLGLFSIGSASTAAPIDQNFAVVATDGDGDSVTSTIQTTIVQNFTGSSAGDNTGTTINGDATANVIAGNGGNDVINGGDGDDFLYGGGGNDTLSGGNGNDVLEGGTGADSLTGGAGNDVFVLSNAAITNGTGNIDTITDYAVGDTIRHYGDPERSDRHECGEPHSAERQHRSAAG